MARKRPILKRLRDGVVYLLVRVLLLVGAYIPPSVGSMLGKMLGVTANLLARKEREKALRNLRLGLGGELSEEELQAVAKGMFINYGRVAFEVIRFRRLTPKRVRKMVEFAGLEMVQEAIESGRGVLVATGHLGNWELMGVAVAQLGVPVNVIARRVNDPRLNDLIIGLRERAGVRTILRESPGSAKRILRCLRRGEMLALLIDQDIRVEGEFVPFFGRPAFTPTGAAALALRTGALLVVASVHRLGPKRHLVRAVPVELNSEGDRERAIIGATARITAQLELWIRERPDQWCWNHDRWRRRPTEQQ